MKPNLLSEVLNSVDFTGEYIFKLIKDVHVGNLIDEEFLLLVTVLLVAGAALNVVAGKTPTTTLSGVIVSLVSIAVMFWLTRTKIRIGTELNSTPIIADGKCTQVCLCMSLVLLASSLVYYATGFVYADAIGAVGLAYFAFKEGREAMEKAANPDTTCGCDCH